MSSNKIILNFIVVLGIAAYARFGFQPSLALQVATRNPSGNFSQTNVASGFLNFQPKSSVRYTYSFERKIQIHGFTNSIPEIAYSGKLFFDVIDSKIPGFDAWVHDEITGQPASVAISLWVHVDPDGKTLQLRSSPSKEDDETAHQNLNILKDLLANWVFPLQSDTSGNYEAAFSAPFNENGFLKETKKKISYEKSKTVVTEILSSSHQLNWSLDLHLPYSISGIDSTRLGNSKLSIASESSYVIRFLSQEACLINNLTSMNHKETLSLSAEENGTIGAHRAPNSHLSWPEINQQLGQLASMTSSEQLRLFGDLLDSLRNHKEDVKNLTALISPAVLAAGPASSLFKIVVGAMATLGTPEAQSALVGVYQDPNCPISGKGTILASLTTTQAPITSTTQEFLIGESKNTNTDLSNGALWALGSSIGSSNSDSQQAIASIEQAWMSATTSLSREGNEITVLDAMGNSGNAQFLAVIEAVINDPSNAVLQSKAIFSLRFIPTSGAQGIMIQQLVNPNPNLRLASARALSLAPWNPSFMSPLQNCAAHELVPEVKNACVNVLQNQSG